MNILHNSTSSEKKDSFTGVKISQSFDIGIQEIILKCKAASPQAMFSLQTSLYLCFSLDAALLVTSEFYWETEVFQGSISTPLTNK